MSDQKKISSSSSRRDHEYDLDEALWPFKHVKVLTDITDKTMEQPYENLSSTSFSSPEFPVEGWVNSPNDRMMVCLNCQCARKPDGPIVKVTFLVDTGSNYTFLSETTIRKLTDSDAFLSTIFVAIQDPTSVIECNLSHSQFREAHVLGMKAMLQLKMSIEGMRGSYFRLVKQ